MAPIGLQKGNMAFEEVVPKPVAIKVENEALHWSLLFFSQRRIAK